ncbi:GAF and ANTAR domain-containing protein [Amycolatopsis carbonis]|uniref:GAF and ANTAR domain-containing protein n=1 Tax=Amycolatopsis carbonis TaxID=715471 RepID=A0A9Y2I893_9PSEU|nr:GAF and ANTAR domain-containing protein [Amycolatopsis sp. 2-15]WIX75149.1 GAF and ANTAR domain-containing protein [Amycolatopsis sp. 2-15]
MTDKSSTASVRETRMVAAFVEMADTLVDDYDVADVLHRLVTHAVELLDAAAAGLMLADQRGSLQVLASSTEGVRLLELFQLQANEGPCVDAYRAGEPILVDDLTRSVQRWPSFAPQAVSLGFAAVHAVPLRLRHEVIGALNLFGYHAGPLTQADLHLAQALADTATIGILQERAIHRGEVLTEQLQTALNSRVIIEQAKGVLFHAGGLDMGQTFEVMRTYARDHSTRLSDIATQLATATLDPLTVLNHRHHPAPQQ